MGFCGTRGGERVRRADLADDSEVGKDPVSSRLVEITEEADALIVSVRMEEGANGALLAPSGMGKTTALIATLLGPYDGKVDQVHVFSPSHDIDSAWFQRRRGRLTWRVARFTPSVTRRP